MVQLADRDLIHNFVYDSVWGNLIGEGVIAEYHSMPQDGVDNTLHIFGGYKVAPGHPCGGSTCAV